MDIATGEASAGVFEHKPIHTQVNDAGRAATGVGMGIGRVDE